MPPTSGNLVWIDLEMTGLDPQRCHIIEIATVVTDSDLEVIGQGPCLVIHNSDDQLETLSDWSRDTFTASGLLDRVRASKIDVAEAERETVEFIKEHCLAETALLCGNSVHTDRAFLAKHMPDLHAWLHYRNVDVSTLKELIRRWHPDQFAPPTKSNTHEALADIMESIAELRYYRDTFIAPPRKV